MVLNWSPVSFAREDFPCSFSLFFLICLCLDSSNRLFASSNSWWWESIGLGFSSSTVSSADHPSLFFDPFHWSMLSYGSGLPGGIFLPILALGSLLGAIVGTFLQNIGFISQNQLPLFIILGMSGYFGAISKAPLTAMILVTEMVGDIRSLMP